jgi:hypothetical protein
MYHEICFTSYYNKDTDKFYPVADKYNGVVDEKYLIEDCYDIGMTLDSDTAEFWACEKNRIEDFAKKNNIDTTDLHVNPGGDLCLAPKNTKHFKENCKDESRFKDNLLIPFLYSHSFFESHRERPWPDYGHGYLGYLEAYHREKNPDSKEKTLDCLFYLKDCSFPIKNLDSPRLLELLKSESEEAFNGVNKLIFDIKKYSLQKYLK